MNREGYSDPTAEKAVENVMREYRKKRQAGGSIGKKSERKGEKGTQTV